MIEVRGKSEIPAGRQGVKKYPFDTMQVGESFLYTDHMDDPLIACRRISAIKGTWITNHKSKKRFTCRQERDKSGNYTGVAVYRVK